MSKNTYVFSLVGSLFLGISIGMIVGFSGSQSNSWLGADLLHKFASNEHDVGQRSNQKSVRDSEDKTIKSFFNTSSTVQIDIAKEGRSEGMDGVIGTADDSSSFVDEDWIIEYILTPTSVGGMVISGVITDEIQSGQCFYNGAAGLYQSHGGLVVTPGFSNDNGQTWTYTPGVGRDCNVTDIRFLLPNMNPLQGSITFQTQADSNLSAFQSIRNEAEISASNAFPEDSRHFFDTPYTAPPSLLSDFDKTVETAGPDNQWGTSDDSTQNVGAGELLRFYVDINENTSPWPSLFFTDSLPNDVCFGSITFPPNLNGNDYSLGPLGVQYSNDNGATWTYTPVGSFDCNVTDIRIDFSYVNSFQLIIEAQAQTPLTGGPIVNTITGDLNNGAEIVTSTATINGLASAPTCMVSSQAQRAGVNNLYYHPGNGGVTQSQINVVDCPTAILDAEHPTSVANSFHYHNACDQLQPGLTPGSAHVGGCTMSSGANPSIQLQVKVCCW